MGWWARSKWGQQDAAADLAVVNGSDTPTKLVAAPGGRKKIVVDDLIVSWQEILTSGAAAHVMLYSGDPDSGGTVLFPVGLREPHHQRTIPLLDLGLRVPTNTELWAVHKVNAGLGTFTVRVSVSYHIERAGAE